MDGVEDFFNFLADFLFVLSVAERGTLKDPSTMANVSISPFGFASSMCCLVHGRLGLPHVLGRWTLLSLQHVLRCLWECPLPRSLFYLIPCSYSRFPLIDVLLIYLFSIFRFSVFPYHYIRSEFLRDSVELGLGFYSTARPCRLVGTFRPVIFNDY